MKKRQAGSLSHRGEEMKKRQAGSLSHRGRGDEEETIGTPVPRRGGREETAPRRSWVVVGTIARRETRAAGSSLPCELNQADGG